MDKAKTVLIVGIVLILWNLLGIYAFVHDFAQTPADLAKLPASQSAMYAGMRSWEWGVYGVGTITGFIGALGIALKRGWAALASLISLIAVAIQFGHAFIARVGANSWDPGAIGFVGFIVLICALQYYLARRWAGKGLLV